MMKTAGGLLLAAVFLAGCGDNGAARKETDAKFRQLDYKVSGMETLNAGSTTNLEAATQEHIALGYCLPCRATLYDEARKY